MTSGWRFDWMILDVMMPGKDRLSGGHRPKSWVKAGALCGFARSAIRRTKVGRLSDLLTGSGEVKRACGRHASCNSTIWRRAAIQSQGDLTSVPCRDLAL